MKQEIERHFFSSGNTSLGFYSYYRYILPQREAEHIYVLKGVPGTDKTGFLTGMGKRLQAEGYSAEYLHCPFGPDSLDGLIIPGLKTALIDGTPPHMLDPVTPGAVDEIVNLGEYLKPEGLKEHREQIIDLNEQAGRFFRRAYRYLAAAGCVMGDLLDMYALRSDCAAAYAQAAAISEKEFAGRPLCAKAADVRRQFASAITPSGIVHYADTLIDDTYKLYIIVSNWGVCVSELLGRISEEASMRGMYVEEYYCPMDPEGRLEHVIIPEAGIAFFSENRYMKLSRRPDAIIDMMGYADSLQNGKDEIGFSEASMSTLINEAVFALKEAKEARSEIELIYAPNIDREAENKKAAETAENILKKEK